MTEALSDALASLEQEWRVTLSEASASGGDPHAAASIFRAHTHALDKRYAKVLKSEEFLEQLRAFFDRYTRVLCAQSTPQFKAMLAGLTSPEWLRSKGCSAATSLIDLGVGSLQHYTPMHGDRQQGRVGPPLLVVYSWVNRPSILDLSPERSLIRAMSMLGHDIYLLDWGYPGAHEQNLDLCDYIQHLMHRCVEHILSTTNSQSLDIIGVCQGGTLSLCYASWRPELVRRLVLLATPVDFHTADDLISIVLRQIDIDALVQGLGNIPGSWVNTGFRFLRPFSTGPMKFCALLDGSTGPAAMDRFIRMELWLQDAPALSGTAFKEFVKTFYFANAFVTDSVQLGQRRLSLRNLSAPVLNAIATRDAIVPPASSRALKALLNGANYYEHFYRTGHIGLLAGRPTCNGVASNVSQWLHSTITSKTRSS